MEMSDFFVSTMNGIYLFFSLLHCPDENFQNDCSAKKERGCIFPHCREWHSLFSIHGGNSIRVLLISPLYNPESILLSSGSRAIGVYPAFTQMVM